MGRKYNVIWLFFSIQVIVFTLIGILFYFSYENKTTWDMQTDINDSLMRKNFSTSTWQLQLDINEVVMERFRWIGESRSILPPQKTKK